MEEGELHESDIYDVILDSPLMDDIWASLDKTTKYEILSKAGWSLVDEYKKILENQND